MKKFVLAESCVGIVQEGDITQVEVDAIVNAANERMLGGMGVDGAIHRAGGPDILAECVKIPEKRPGVRCETGEAKITTAGNLPAKYVIHTVGPVWHGGEKGEEQLLHNAYSNSLLLARNEGLKTVAFPSISTGIYGYPIEQAAPVALNAVKSFIEGDSALSEVRFILFSQGDLEVYQKEI